MANAMGQSSAVSDSHNADTDLGALKTLAAPLSSAPIIGLGAQSTFAAPGSNMLQVRGGIGGGQAASGGEIPVPALSTPVQAPAPAAIPSGLFCGPREYWGWAYSTGTGIGNSYTYLMRFAFYS